MFFEILYCIQTLGKRCHEVCIVSEMGLLCEEEFLKGFIFLLPVRLLTFTKRVTSSVFTNVTIGTGDDIHIYQLLAVSDCKDTDSFVYDQISGIICTQFVINDIKTTRYILRNGEKNVFLQ